MRGCLSTFSKQKSQKQNISFSWDSQTTVTQISSMKNRGEASQEYIHGVYFEWSRTFFTLSLIVEGTTEKLLCIQCHQSQFVTKVFVLKSMIKFFEQG